MVHGDDFLSIGDHEDLIWLQKVLEEKFEISTNMVGHGVQDEKQLKVLNRIISAEEYGFTYEPDARHAEILIRDLGLTGAKAVATPGDDFCDLSEDLLEHEKFKKYQSLCARANFLATDRMDVQFASKECCRAMSRPRVRDWAKIKRMGRYLVGKPRLVYRYPFQDEVQAITVYSDASWPTTRRTEGVQAVA